MSIKALALIYPILERHSGGFGLPLQLEDPAAFSFSAKIVEPGSDLALAAYSAFIIFLRPSESTCLLLSSIKITHIRSTYLFIAYVLSVWRPTSAFNICVIFLFFVPIHSSAFAGCAKPPLI